MKKMENRYPVLKYVSALQELGSPFVSLYIEETTRQLFIAIRYGRSENGYKSFICFPVSVEEILSYLNEQTGLITLLKKQKKFFNIKSDETEDTVISAVNTFTPDNRIEKMNIFDPELCDDLVWTNIFLKRISENRPIETI